MAKRLRCEILSNRDIDAVVLTSSDSHCSEYYDFCPNKLWWEICKFSSNIGTIFVSLKKKVLWTDGKSFFNAMYSCPDWKICKTTSVIGQQFVDVIKFIREHEFDVLSIGMDSSLISYAHARWFSTELAKEHHSMKFIDDLFEFKFLQSMENVFVLSENFTGDCTSSKLARFMTYLTDEGKTALVMTKLDDIFWLLNIRCKLCDIPYNPVTYCYFILHAEGRSALFIDEGILTDSTKDMLSSHMDFLPYRSVYEYIRGTLVPAAEKTHKPVSLDPNQVNYRICNMIPAAVRCLEESMVAYSKCYRNRTELRNTVHAHLLDSAAITATLHWLEERMQTEVVTTEWDVSVRLEGCRRRFPSYLYPSFGTIAAYGANGADLVYLPTEKQHSVIGYDSLLLFDSGGHYFEGTTDVTRTMHYGAPTQKMRDCYTWVLKGHIAIATLKFPSGTLGSSLDAMSRLELWKQGLDFSHGTGHGVGVCLNVVDGPHGLGYVVSGFNEVELEGGMVLSNEPGFYEDREDQQFGIRIENVVITVPAVSSPLLREVDQDREFLCLDTISFIPLQRNLINISLLTKEEVVWINNYHHKVYEVIAPIVSTNFPEAMQFLRKETLQL